MIVSAGTGAGIDHGRCSLPVWGRPLEFAEGVRLPVNIIQHAGVQQKQIGVVGGRATQSFNDVDRKIHVSGEGNGLDQPWDKNRLHTQGSSAGLTAGTSTAAPTSGFSASLKRTASDGSGSASA